MNAVRFGGGPENNDGSGSVTRRTVEQYTCLAARQEALSDTETDVMTRSAAQRLGLPERVPTAASKVGIARNVGSGQQPLNGLRHSETATTCGWYLWAGEVLSEDADFFEPLHVEHLADRCPEVLPYLSLPPGWRFLIAPGYEDVWLDLSLLDGPPGEV